MILGLFIFFVTLISCSSKDGFAPNPYPPVVCPANFVYVKAVFASGNRDFCVSKYDMKDVGGVPQSIAAGTPWSGISRDQAIAACQSLGARYDLITNNQWQMMAMDIANTAVNWSSGTAYIGSLNQGHSDNDPATSLAASDDDNQPCFGTNQVCSSTVWHQQRRTHVLSTGGLIWDVAGNLWKLVKDDNDGVPKGAADFVSNYIMGDARQTMFGHTILCDNPAVSPYCGYGYGFVDLTNSAIVRGAQFSGLDNSGVFATSLSRSTTQLSNATFKCVFQ